MKYRYSTNKYQVVWNTVHPCWYYEFKVLVTG